MYNQQKDTEFIRWGVIHLCYAGKFYLIVDLSATLTSKVANYTDWDA